MLLTLPLILFIVMAELSVGAFTVLFVLDWRNEVKRSFLITYALIYLVLTGLTYLFQQGFSPPELLNTYTQLDKAWTGYLRLPLLLFLLLMLPYNLLLWLDRSAGVDGRQKEDIQVSRLRLLRLISGGLVVLVGLVTLFVLAMIYRPIASTNAGGVFTVAGFFAAALALGGVMTAMWLGHWYLVSPTLSTQPLVRVNFLCMGAIAAQLVILPLLLFGPGANANAVQVMLSDDALFLGVRIVFGLVVPLIACVMTWRTARIRSLDSATGLLYIVAALVLAGEIAARSLFFLTGVAT